MDSKLKTYENDHLIVYWNQSLCQHAGECVRGHNKVFNIERRPWIKLDEATDEEIMRIIDRCPSKALTYKLKG